MALSDVAAQARTFLGFRVLRDAGAAMLAGAAPNTSTFRSSLISKKDSPANAGLLRAEKC